MLKKEPDWKLYELFVARILVEQAATDLCITANAKILGMISGRKRQIDVLIESRHDTDRSRRIIVDAKRRRRKIDVTQVEAFEGLMKDVGAAHGYLVCPMGHTEAAQRRAQKGISVRLLPWEDLRFFAPQDWPACQSGQCKDGYVLWDGFPGPFLKLISPKTGELSEVSFVHFVGKCVTCGRFHVRCTTCRELFGLSDEDEHQCNCKLPWFWLSSIESEDDGTSSAQLHWISGVDEYITVNRWPL